MFPARAGMSPHRKIGCTLEKCVPRASGDEPGTDAVMTAWEPCSPRERG